MVYPRLYSDIDVEMGDIIAGIQAPGVPYSPSKSARASESAQMDIFEESERRYVAPRSTVARPTARPVPVGTGLGAGALPLGLAATQIGGLAGLSPGESTALGLGGLVIGSLFGDSDGESASSLVPYGFGGPGLAEPPAEWTVKEWKRRIDSREGDYNLQYYLVKYPGRPYRIYMYSQRTRAWKSWGMPHPAVIGKNMPSHKMLTRLRRNLRKHVADAKTIMQVASPAAFAKTAGYHKHQRRR